MAKGKLRNGSTDLAQAWVGARLAALWHRAKTLKTLEDAVATGILTQEEADERAALAA